MTYSVIWIFLYGVFLGSTTLIYNLTIEKQKNSDFQICCWPNPKFYIFVYLIELVFTKYHQLCGFKQEKFVSYEILEAGKSKMKV